MIWGWQLHTQRSIKIWDENTDCQAHCSTGASAVIGPQIRKAVDVSNRVSAMATYCKLECYIRIRYEIQ
jgi:hypothetical protein